MNLFDALNVIGNDTASIYLDIGYEGTIGVVPNIVIKGYDYTVLSQDTLARRVSRIGTKNDGSIVICTYKEEG